MKDFLGNELEVGDQVITTDSDYKEFLLVTITRFTKCKVFVHWKGKKWGFDHDKELRRNPEQIVKVTAPA